MTWKLSLLNYVKFSYFLDDILKQFKMVGSLKEQQVQSHKRIKDLSRETLMGEKTQQNFLSIELNQNNVKPKTTASLFFPAHFFFLLQTCLSEVSTNEGGALLFIFDS